MLRLGGDFGDGAADRLRRMGDESHIEPPHASRVCADLNESTRKDLDALRVGIGVRTFAVHPLDLYKVDALLREHGLNLDPPPPLTYDPDGAGPAAPSAPNQTPSAR